MSIGSRGVSSPFSSLRLCVDGPGIGSSTKLEAAKEETTGCGAELATSAERPGDSGVSTATLTSKLMTLGNVSVEPADEI